MTAEVRGSRGGRPGAAEVAVTADPEGHLLELATGLDSGRNPGG